MLERAIRSYYKFFDETLSSSTFLVGIVACLICALGIIIPNTAVNAEYIKGSVMQVNQLSTEKNIVEIDGVEYELQFVKVK